MEIVTTAVLTRHGDNGSLILQNAILRALQNAQKLNETDPQKLREIIYAVVDLYNGY